VETPNGLSASASVPRIPTLYRTELKQLQADIQKIAKPGATENLTHASFGVSNRANQMVIGLCSLVEVRLFILAKTAKSQFKLSDMRGGRASTDWSYTSLVLGLWTSAVSRIGIALRVSMN
jgi:hypothetical protein